MTSSIDPRAEVEAPVRRALDALVVRSTIGFAAAVFAVLVGIGAADGPLHTVAHLALPGVLVGVLFLRTAHVMLRREPIGTDGAWSRAREIERGETDLATFLSFLVPVAWLVGWSAILYRHAGHHDAAALVAIWLPLAGGLWFVTTIAWIHDCRERLARAVDESSRRFRAYWSEVRAT